MYSGANVSSSSAPLVSHLDAQLNAMRTELATLYRTQAAAQNKQLAMADSLRDRDEEVRGLREEVRELREARDGGTRREKNWEERWRMRDEDVKVSDAASAKRVLTRADTARRDPEPADRDFGPVAAQCGAAGR